MKAQSTLLLLAGLVAGLAASCYVTPATEGLPCEEDEACTDGQFCAEGKCRYQCEGDWDCDGQICPAGACIPCNVDCGNGMCCGEGWHCTDDGGCCPPSQPVYCGNQVCAPSAAQCPDGGGPDGGGDDGGGDDGGTGDTPEEDPEYPRPDGAGNCPPEMVRFVTGDTTLFCAPPCEPNGVCPDGATGGANGECVLSPGSSTEDCSETNECSNPEETCELNANGDMVCLLPASHCVLFCDPGAQNCPVQMECHPDEYCFYP
jgi:hypothetical protein